MAMYKSLFDLSPEQTASTAMPRTVVFSNGTGSGSMTICPLFWVQSCIITICTLHSLRKPRHQCGMSLRSTTAAWGVTSAVLGQIAAAIWQQGILRCVQQRAKSRPPAFRCGTTTASPSYWIWMRFRRKCGNKWNGTA